MLTQVRSTNGTGSKSKYFTLTPAHLPEMLFDGDCLNWQFFYDDIAMRSYMDDYDGVLLDPYRERRDVIQAQIDRLRELEADMGKRKKKLGDDEILTLTEQANDLIKQGFTLNKEVSCHRAAHLIKRVVMPNGEAAPNPHDPMSFLNLELPEALAAHETPVLDVLTNPAFVQEVLNSKKDPLSLMRFITGTS